MPEKELIAVDLDGTVHRYGKGWQGDEVYDRPMDGAKEALKYLADNFKVVIFTARKKHEPVEEWLKKHDLDQYVEEVTNIKPPGAFAFIDDKDMITFTTWPKAIEEVKKLKSEGKVELSNEILRKTLHQIEAFITKLN
jgi:FMN phosphatase YigB (HAD superfamily)